MQGYLGKDEATVAAFQNLWFHTGDAVVKAADGYYYFEDRMGDRIRVRGENLSSFQIEDMISQHDDVQMVAALSIPSREGDEDEVVVFVTPMSDTLDEAEIHRFAAETMPKYMRPAHVRIIPELPQTATNLFAMGRVRLVAEACGVKSVDLAEHNLQVRFHDQPPIETMRLVSLVAEEGGSLTPSGMLLVPAPPRGVDRIHAVSELLSKMTAPAADEVGS